MVDLDYTSADHAFREDDAYAAGKYDVTLRWLGEVRSGGRHLLNVGCGSGLFNRLATEHGYAVEACEPDPVASDIARRTAPPGVTIATCGLLEVEPAAAPDVIVMHDVLEHIEDDAAAVRRLRELLPPDGIVVLSVPALPALFGRHDELLGHYRRYVRRSLRAVLEPCFTIDRLRYYGMSLIPVTLWFSRIRRDEYPAQTASSGAVGRAFRAICNAEARVPTPIGTSLICLARPRPPA
jgi:SAM-dependent methyltransferase